MDNTKKTTILGYASGIGAGNHDCSLGPDAINKSKYFSKINHFIGQFKFFRTPEQVEKLEAIPAIARVNTELAQTCAQLIRNNNFFITLGGDNCCSIGSWSGTASAKREQGALGLIWLDAHLDSHTPQSSESKNVHGMPLAVLLGYGDKQLTYIEYPSPKIAPENVCIIGARSYEAGEKALLESLGVRIYYMPEVNQRGFHDVMNEAVNHVNRHTIGYGICLDLDVIDPKDAPGVGTPEPNGIEGTIILKELMAHKDDNRLQGLEIVEFNPQLDLNHKTENIIIDLISHFSNETEK